MQPTSSDDLRTPDEWLMLKHPNLKVYDPDGWRGLSGRPWTDPISEDEFDQRLVRCTIGGTFGRDAA
jgi:hypothetical protein